MTAPAPYPKRLIEVDLPIRRISAHARREKSIRHGHISTLHIWWARRPLAACRAVICAALWPDPADPLCPASFREFARARMRAWVDLATRTKDLASVESFRHFTDIQKRPALLDDDEELRRVLLDFIADFANWDNSTNQSYLETARALTQSAHEALGGEPGTRPLVVDPFAGGGAIPLEALRVGADAFASDLNPVAVLLNKVVLEYIPKYGQRLADEVRKWGQWIQEQAEKELAEFYPMDPDGATPIAYLWARTIRCEGPGCGAEVPLMRSLWLAKRSKGAVALRLTPDEARKQVHFEIIENATAKDVTEGTVRKGSATCPVCGFTTPITSVRGQLAERSGGSRDATLFCVVTAQNGEQGRRYRSPNESDYTAVTLASAAVQMQIANQPGAPSIMPDEPLPPSGTLGFRVQLYGMRAWSDLYTTRQLLTLATISGFVQSLRGVLIGYSPDFMEAIQGCLALAVGRLADRGSSLCTWDPSPAASGILHTFGRQALPFIWDFAEGNPFEQKSGGWLPSLEWIALVLARESKQPHQGTGTAVQATAASHPLPDATVAAVITDPPYYDAVPYADLSDFFFVWLKRCLPILAGSSSNSDGLTPKIEECIVDPAKGKNQEFFHQKMMQSMLEARRVLLNDGVGIVVFAHKSTAGWEAQLQALVDAGWVISGSWPIDTEMSTRLRAHGSAALASSIHLVCRPRDTSGANIVGDWRDVLAELPRRIHSWMPRLVAEGVVGADAIFACLGPAVEIFSRYERVEKASGEVVTLREYLPYVWAAVSREALSTIFEQADATGFEEDARLTALWLWTLFGGQSGQTLQDVTDAEPADEGEGSETDEDDEGGAGAKKPATGGTYVLEFDAARKLAQGLGAHLERLATVVEVKGEKARLLPVSERSRFLFGKEHAQPVVPQRRRGRAVQTALPGFPSHPHQTSLDDMLPESDQSADGWTDTTTPEPGGTVLDRLHQSMLLFAAGRTEALRRFLVENGIGQDDRFWRLAQALSALYPMGSDEKRWVDGVLARKKGWGM